MLPFPLYWRHISTLLSTLLCVFARKYFFTYDVELATKWAKNTKENCKCHSACHKFMPCSPSRKFIWLCLPFFCRLHSQLLFEFFLTKLFMTTWSQSFMHAIDCSNSSTTQLFCILWKSININEMRVHKTNLIWFLFIPRRHWTFPKPALYSTSFKLILNFGKMPQDVVTRWGSWIDFVVHGINKISLHIITFLQPSDFLHLLNEWQEQVKREGL